MELLHVFILAVVEGVTEFLPVSSTGHMILIGWLLGISQSDFAKSFEIVIQLGAILAVVVLYWRRLVFDIEGWKRLVVAMIPTGILGLMVYKIVKTLLLGNAMVVVISLVVGGVFIIVVEKWGRFNTQVNNFNKLTFGQAFWVGVGQSLAMIPGVSRSAATIITGRAVGLSRQAATEFSFVLAIPTMILATGYDLYKSQGLISGQNWQVLGWGIVGAFLTALIAVKMLVAYVQKHSLASFGVYRIVLGLVFWWVILR
jgi:undecaprenyl-diphosphatase